MTRDSTHDDDITASPTPSPRSGGGRVVRELRVVFSVAGFEPPVIAMERDAIMIGREPPRGLGIELEDKRASRTHVVVERRDEHWVVRDRGSHNGTWVDGARCEESVVGPGSIIRIGSTIILVSERPAVPVEATRSGLIAASGGMRKVRGDVQLAAMQPLPILLIGETGVGKEVVAREIHRISERPGQFVAVNCSAISAALAESELFGHVAGSFTGASGKRDGLFDAARGGTLLLDEVGEMPLELQPKLLRALALGEVRAVGSAESRTVDVQVVAATNRDLTAEVAAGTFRADLLARLSGWHIQIPPLRERREDILPLAKQILAKHGAVPLSADSAEALLLYPWPFNVRELEQTLSVASVRAKAVKARSITLAHLPPAIAEKVTGRAPISDDATAPSGGEVADHEAPPGARELAEALERTNYNISAVARQFGKERRQIYRWIERHGLRKK